MLKEKKSNAQGRGRGRGLSRLRCFLSRRFASFALNIILGVIFAFPLLLFFSCGNMRIFFQAFMFSVKLAKDTQGRPTRKPTFLTHFRAICQL